MLKAGMTRVDITPPLGLGLDGYPHYPRYNTGFHDPLYAACMYLNSNGNEIVMVTLDLLFFSKLHVAAIRKKVEKECGIKGSNIMISCSHTHSGPMSAGAFDLDDVLSSKQQPMEYIQDIIEKISNAIIQAKKESFDASFASGTSLCGAESGIGGNRRLPGGPHDPLVSVMAIRDNNKDVRGVIVNYTLHPTFIHEWSNVCTADYPCYVKMEIEEKAPKALVGFAQGCSGNQSSRYYRQGESYDEAERVGRTLGKAAYTVIEKAEWKSDIDIKIAGSVMDIELREFKTEEELRAQVEHDEKVYKELYEKYGNSKNRDEYYLWQNANLKYLGSEDQLGYVAAKNRGIKIELLEDEAPAEIQIFIIDDTCVVGVPGEIFVEYGLYIKAMVAYRNVIINELSNGCLPGYLYTPESTVLGGYETGASMIGEKFGRHLVDKVLDTIETL